MMRTTRAAVAVLSVLLMTGPLALSAHTAESPCPAVSVHGDWSTIHAPTFTAGGSQNLTDYAVHPLSPTRMWVTNGEQVLTTQDGGCSWKPFFEIELLPSLDKPISSANARVTHIEVSEHPVAANQVFLVVEETVGPASRPRVVVPTGDQGGMEILPSEGLPTVTGGVLGLHAAPSDPDVLYLQVRRDTNSVDDDIYASVDGGSSWEKRNTNENTASQDMAVDPLNARVLWTWGVSGLWRSLDGGRTRSYFDQVAPPTPLVDVFHAPGEPTRVMAYEAETGSFMITRDDGATWERIVGPPGAARSITHGNDADDVVMAQHLRVDRFEPPSYWVRIKPGYKQPDLAQLSADRTQTPSVYGMTSNSIERWTGFNNTVDLNDFVDVDPAEFVDTTSLRPASTTVRLKAGAAERVKYSFELPAHPKPVDVFFLLDTSDSMDGPIDGLRKGMQRIVNELERSKLDAQFGVGEIKDYPIPGYGDPVAGDFPYRLNRKIGPADDSLGAALEQLNSSGGGRTDYPESQLTGLYQAATGEGEPGCVVEPGATNPPCVIPGQDAGFREDALKIIVNITDINFHDEAAHPSPPFGQVADALNEVAIEQIGVAVWGSQGRQGLEAAIGDLSDMAKATGTLAPEPVDCDEDGRADVAAGAPLVCALSEVTRSGSVNLAPTIISTVRAIAQDVSVELVTGRDARRVVEVTPKIYPTVDISEQNELTFGITFSCPRSLAGTKHDVTLVARVSGVPAATATAQIICRKIPVVPPAPEEPPAPVLAVPAPAPIAAVAVAPAPPPPVTETVTSTQSAAQAQGAVAKQEQEQVQFAVAVARFKNDEAYALSAYTESSKASPAPLYVTAALMSLATAFLALARPRTRLARNRARR